MKNLKNKFMKLLIITVIASFTLLPITSFAATDPVEIAPEPETYYALITGVQHIWKYSSGIWQNGASPGSTVQMGFSYNIPAGATDVKTYAYDPNTLALTFDEENFLSSQKNQNEFALNYYRYASNKITNINYTPTTGKGIMNVLLTPVDTLFNLKQSLQSADGITSLRTLIGDWAVDNIIANKPTLMADNVEGYLYFTPIIIEYTIGVTGEPVFEPQPGVIPPTNVTPPAQLGNSNTVYAYPGSEIVLTTKGTALSDLSPAAGSSIAYKCNPSYKKIDTRADAYIKFNGQTYSKKDISCPAGDSIYVYQKVTVPTVPGTYVANYGVTTGRLSLSQVGTTVIVIDPIKLPLDPTANDKSSQFPVAYSYNGTETRSATSTWTDSYKAVWHSNIISHRVTHYRDVTDEFGTVTQQKYYTYYSCDHGYWTLTPVAASVSMNLSGSNVKADAKCYTALNNGKTIKSGYGIDQTIKATVTGSTGAYAESLTYSTYPEFGYGQIIHNGLPTGIHLMEKVNGSYVLIKNTYSPSVLRSHFTPIWFKDSAAYKPLITSIFYTPTGKIVLSEIQTGMTIKGNMFEDYQSVRTSK